MATKKVSKKAAKAPAKNVAKAKSAPIVKKASRLPGPMIQSAAKKSARRTTAEPVTPIAALKPIKIGIRPLDGIRVLDLSRLLPGPYASSMLANFGAEVIKIERPGEGDYARDSHPQINGVGAVFETINRGKKSVALDLKYAKGKDAFLALVRKADIVIDGFRPGVMDGLGLGYKKLHRLNPKLIYAALTGYGQDGPYSNLAGHDLNYIALGGMLDLVGSTGGMPSIPGAQIADVAAGSLPTVIGILLALHSRKSTGKGQMVDIAMLDAVLGLLPGQVADYTATKRKPKRCNERLFGRYACYNIYPARNGRYLAVGALEPKFWKALCEALGRDDLIEDQYADGDRQQVVMAELTRVFQKKEIVEWMEIFEGKDVCVTEVRDVSHAVQDEHIRQRHMIVPTRTKDGGVYEQLGVFPKLSSTPGAVSGDSPARGEHTKEVLRSVGYTVKSIDELVKRKIAEQPDSK
jgi:crotonobetainyl-CoA:carnitine CoA-transferase CaiB-like acyl-CoA transferase